MKYRKKPVVVEAIVWDGKNYREISDFAKSLKDTLVDPIAKKVYITTLEGTMTADIGDYIIKGIKGEFYPCKPDIFEKTYELITQSL